MNEDVPGTVEHSHGEKAKHAPEETARGGAPVERLHRQVVAIEPPAIHYTELAGGRADSPIAKEWDFYRRAAGRLLAEGHENRWVLIKGEEIIGVWDTENEARAVALQKYLMKPCLIHQIRSREPVLRAPTRLWLCRS
jgi:hypothetical protein